MKKTELDNYESDILEAFEKGELTPVPDMAKEIKRYSRYAENTLKKDKRVNIRMSEQIGRAHV